MDAWEALDSRGTPTVACAVLLADGSEGQAAVPSGASTGSHEAHERRDGGERYGGKGVAGAVASLIAEIDPALTGLEAGDLARVDATMRELDGTPSLSRLGANAVLAASVACALAEAQSRAIPLWQLFAPDLAPLLPLPMVNVISGGAHAGGLVDVQDFLVVPVGARTFAEAIEWASRVRAATAAVLRERGHDVFLVADEGGLAAPLPSNRVALDVLLEGIAQSGLEPGAEAAIAVDVAATQLLVDDRYMLGIEGRALRSEELVDEIAGWADDFPIVSIEDPVGEDDVAGWRYATARLGDRIQLLGDDLFATSAVRLETQHPERGRERRARQAKSGRYPHRGSSGGRAREKRRVCNGCLRPLGRDRGQLARRPCSRLARRSAQGRLDDPFRTHREVEPASPDRSGGRRRRVRGTRRSCAQVMTSRDPGSGAPPGPARCCSTAPCSSCRQYDDSSARTSVMGGCTIPPAYEPVALRWASRLAWAPVNAARIVVATRAEAAFETSFEALSARGKSIRQPPTATAAIIRPSARPNRVDMRYVSRRDCSTVEFPPVLGLSGGNAR